MDSVLFREIATLKPRKGDLRKIKIVEAAVEILADQGLEGLSFESIGKRLKMRRSHVAYYFESREEIVEMVVHYVAVNAQAMTADLMQTKHTWQERLAAIPEAAILWAEKYPKHASAMVLFYYLCTYEARYRKRYAEIRAVGRQRIAGLLTPLTETGELNASQVGHLAKALQEWMVGTVLIMIIGEQETDATKTLRQFQKDMFRLVDRYRDENKA